MLLMCEICHELRDKEQMNHFHSVNVQKLNTHHVDFFTCINGNYEGKELKCTTEAEERLIEISGLLTKFHTGEDY